MMKQETKKFALKLFISISAAAGLTAHIYCPNIRIDAITISLFILVALPWLAAIIKSAELPGGWKVEFQDIKKAGDKVTAEAPPNLPTSIPSYVSFAPADPNLALVGLRIEIEKRLRTLAERHEIGTNRPLAQTIRSLQSNGILTDPSTSGLQELVMAGNQAAHGARVDPAVADWAMEYGPRVLSVLDAKIQD